MHSWIEMYCSIAVWVGVLWTSILNDGVDSLNTTKAGKVIAKHGDAKAKGGEFILDKKWMQRQRQILTILNSIHNCKRLTKEMEQSKWNVMDHLKQYKNSTTVKKYVAQGFNDVERLFDIFWYNWDNPELIYNTSVYLLQKEIHPVELFYGLGSVVATKSTKSYIKMPPPYDVFSEFFLGRAEDEEEVEDITKTLNKKPGLDYYLEDPGLRSFYVSWFLYNPLWRNKEYNVTEEKTGELFLYVIHQLYARYNAARISEGNMKELGQWKVRAKNTFIKEIDELLGEMVWHAGPDSDIQSPLEKIGNIILKKFKNGKNYFMELITVSNSKLKYRTDLNNFYHILRHVRSFTLGAKTIMIKPYTSTDLEFDGVTLESLKIVYKGKNKTEWKDNMFYTKWNFRKYYVKKCHQRTVSIDKRILDHEDFEYELQIESLLETNNTKATIDIFLSPKFEFDGKPVLPSEYYKYMFQMDHFEINLHSGENKYYRSSTLSSIFSKGDHPYVRQIQELNDAEAGYTQISTSNRKRLNCGLPYNLMVPKGGERRPIKFILFTLITPSSPVDGDFNICGGGGGSGDKFTKSFGFPFDRQFESENLLQELNNHKMIQVGSIMIADEESENL